MHCRECTFKAHLAVFSVPSMRIPCSARRVETLGTFTLLTYFKIDFILLMYETIFLLFGETGLMLHIIPSKTFLFSQVLQ